MGGRGRDSRGGRLGVDVGGTFTDLVAIQHGRLVTAKVPSTPRDQSVGVIGAVDAAALEPADIAVFAHGSTVATNALLERRGGRTALVTTAGFRDVLEIGRQNRPSLYDLTAQRPPPLVPRALRLTVRERMGPQGVVEPLDERDLGRVVDELVEADVEAVAVCLLFGFLHPAHEQRVGERVRAALPGVPVSLASDLLPEFREYERAATVTADAYLAPRLAAYLGRLADRAGDRGLASPLVMQSSGGVVDVRTAVAHPARFVLSGPAAGVVGASYVGLLSGHHDLLTFDMGGTSTDVAPVVGGEVQTTTESVVAGVPLKLPMVDVHTVSAGGGSVAWVDEGGVLRVGPHSAGADPGPVAYGLGGEEPTVTDADLLLGYLADGTTLGGEVTLSRDRAQKALRDLGRRLDLSAEEAALGVARVATTEMVRALRVISVERGLDPRDFALVAFGGAGGMHACAMAEELGVHTVLLPRAAGVLSALGLALSDIRRDYVAPLLGRVDELAPETLDEAWDGLVAPARQELASFGEPRTERLADLRSRGQSYELIVAGGTPEALARAFHDAHERRYGHHDDDEVVEIVGVRLVATVAGEKPDISEPDPLSADARTGRRPVLLEEGEVDAEVHDRSVMGRGSDVSGPAVVELAEATWLVRPGWSGGVDEVGTLVLTREQEDR
jgi:N-methylhydantoinase A